MLITRAGNLMTSRRSVPYRAGWLAVVLISVVGTLVTDTLTDSQGVPLAVSSTIFAVALALVLAIWYLRERTLSIHSDTTTPREGFYWLAVLVTFAVGTAVGDWTLELTGWTPGAAVLLPLLGRDEGGLGLGTLWTSVLFLAAILATVVYLTRSRRDQTELVRG